ncbi:unnamed protein product [Durusdinium trenchii]|uniref:Uncharacterized protein n=1 Tax=Durusdinium trenchii TaxID=1381693 RepID=A0ABP0RFR7_9DINO
MGGFLSERSGNASLPSGPAAIFPGSSAWASASCSCERLARPFAFGLTALALPLAVARVDFPPEASLGTHPDVDETTGRAPPIEIDAEREVLVGRLMELECGKASAPSTMVPHDQAGAWCHRRAPSDQSRPKILGEVHEDHDADEG